MPLDLFHVWDVQVTVHWAVDSVVKTVQSRDETVAS